MPHIFNAFKILSQIPLKQNDVLDLVNVFIPPLMSSTMNENILNRVKGPRGISSALIPS